MQEEFKDIFGDKPAQELQAFDNCISGTIKYHIVSPDEVFADIELVLKKDYLSELLKERKDNRYVIIMIDRSQSMAGPKIERIKVELKKFAKPIIEKGTAKLITILFDHKNIIIEGNDKDFARYCEQIDHNLTPGAGSSYSQPLQYLLEFIQKGEVKELFAMFITDGFDINQDDSTDYIIEKIRQEVKSKSIISKFSVFGIGEHDTGKVVRISEIGLLKAPYFYVNNYQPIEEAVDSITQFFNDSKLEMKLPKGILIAFKDFNKKILVTLDDVQKDIVILRHPHTIIQGFEIVEYFKRSIQPTIVHSLGLTKAIETKIAYQKIYTMGFLIQYQKLAEQLGNLDFSKKIFQLLPALFQIKFQCEENLHKLRIVDYLPENFQRLYKDIIRIERNLQRFKEKNIDELYYHDRAVLEQMRMGLVKRLQLQSKEYRIGKYEQVEQAMEKVMHKIIDCKNYIYQVRAIGSRDVVKMFQVIETINSKIEDKFVMHKQIYVSMYDDRIPRIRNPMKFLTVIMKIMKKEDLQQQEEQESLFGMQQNEGVQEVSSQLKSLDISDIKSEKLLFSDTITENTIIFQQSKTQLKTETRRRDMIEEEPQPSHDKLDINSLRIYQPNHWDIFMYKHTVPQFLFEKLILLYENPKIKETTFICQSEDEVFNFNVAYGLFREKFPMLKVSMKSERVRFQAGEEEQSNFMLMTIMTIKFK